MASSFWLSTEPEQSDLFSSDEDYAPKEDQDTKIHNIFDNEYCSILQMEVFFGIIEVSENR